MTPWGQAKFNAVRGSFTYSRAPGIAPPVAPEKEWNDPMLQCEPAGYPRVMLQIFAPLMRFIQTSNEVVEFFEWGHTFRDIWTDGRKPLESPEPTYYGYSVGRWDGDTFVVDSNGFNDRTWTDPLGSPHSDQMTLHEVFRRVDHDHLELVITLTDPKTYTQALGERHDGLRLGAEITAIRERGISRRFLHLFGPILLLQGYRSCRRGGCAREE